MQPLTPFTVMMVGWRRATVVGASPDTTLADVVERLCDRPGPAAVLIDGRLTATSQSLVGSGIRHGSRIALATDGAPRRVHEPRAGRPLEAVWVAGPDAGDAVAIGDGRNVVGRAATADVRCGDRAVELHHAVLDVDDGRIWLRQLSGLTPILIGDVTASGRQPVALGQRIEVGSSVLVVRECSSQVPATVVAPPRPDDPWRRPFVRSPRALVTESSTSIEVPRTATTPGGMAGGLLPTVLGVAGAAVLALVFHQLMFLLFGLMGAVVALGTWVAQRVGLVRTRASVTESNRLAVETFTTALAANRSANRAAVLANAPTLDGAITAAATRSAALWAVRPTDRDAFHVSIGFGDGFCQPPIVGAGNASADVLAAIDEASRLGVVPIIASISDGTVTAVVGHGGADVVRSMVVQLAARSGPADWRLAIVSDRLTEWDGFVWLDQIADGEGLARLVRPAAVDAMVATLDDTDARHLVVVVDGPSVLHSRTDALRRLLAGRTPTAFIVLCASEAEIPAAATRALIVGRGGLARWIADTRVSALAEPVRIAGISARRAADFAASIADLVDPEHEDDASSLPRAVSVAELLSTDIGTEPDRYAHTIADCWSSAGADPPLRCPIGTAVDGVVDVDLVRDGPHALVAGTTGAGKSELLRTLVLGLATRSSPEHVSFVLIDYKGGSTFDACVHLPHVVGVVTDLDERLASRALRSLEAELRRREHLLRDAGVSDLAAYRARRASAFAMPAAPLPRLVVIVDEFATLAAQVPEFMRALLGIAQRGRSLGVHLLLATQRPHGVVDENIRANTNLRIALRVQDAADGIDVVGDAAPATLPRTIPGRAAMRLGADDLIAFQTASCSGPHRPNAGAVAGLGAGVRGLRVDDVVIDGVPLAAVAHAAALSPGLEAGERTEMAVLVDAIVAAATAMGIAPPHRPWHPALPETVTVDDLEPNRGAAVIGIVDDPDHQRRSALTWPVGAGHLVLAGSTGSGTTTALLAIAAAIERSDVAAEVFVIDALGDPRLDVLESSGALVALVRLHERERMMRMLDHLCRLIATRRSSTGSAGGAPFGDVVVLVDGLGALRADLESAEQWRQLEQLDSLIDDGLAVGLRVAMTVTRCGSVPSRLVAQIGCRWIFPLADPLDAAVFGVAARLVPPGIPGRLVDATTGREAHIIEPVDGASSATVTRPPPRAAARIGELAAEIDLGDLPQPIPSAGELVAAIGIGFESLSPAVLRVASGEHVLVIGPARTGRSTALIVVADCWRAAHPSGWIGCVAPRRSSVCVGMAASDVAELLASMPTTGPVLLVVDDAELVDDPTGQLAARITARAEGLTVVAAGRPDSLRASFGHWTTAIRRCRLGIVMAGASDLDADLLGAVLPRRLPISIRPGLAWLIGDGDRELVQLARCAAPDRVACSFDVAGAVP